MWDKKKKRKKRRKKLLRSHGSRSDTRSRRITEKEETAQSLKDAHAAKWLYGVFTVEHCEIARLAFVFRKTVYDLTSWVQPFTRQVLDHSFSLRAELKRVRDLRSYVLRLRLIPQRRRGEEGRGGDEARGGFKVVRMDRRSSGLSSCLNVARHST